MKHREQRWLAAAGALAGFALLAALELVEEPGAGLGERLGDLAEIALEVATAGAVAFWLLAPRGRRSRRRH